MSFSKARIQRFNELGSEAPPPGAYDPKFENKVKGLAIEKTERFQDSKSVSSSAECMSVSSKGAGSTSGLKFKTPPVPRRKVLVKHGTMSCPRAKTKLLICPKESKAQYDMKNELADLKVECSNKDKTIQDQEKHIEDMIEEITDFKKRLIELNEKCINDEEQYRRDIESMAKLQQEVLLSHQEKHKVELDFLRSQLLELANFKKEEILGFNRREVEFMDEIVAFKCKEAELNNRIHMLENNLSNAQGVEELALNLKKAEERLNELSTEMLDIIDNKDHELETLMDLKSEIEDELNIIREEFQESQQRANDLERNLENLTESLESNLASSKSKFTSEILDFIDFSLNSLNTNEENVNILMEDKEIEAKFENLEKECEAEKFMRHEYDVKHKESNETLQFLTEELEKIQMLYKDASLQLQMANAKLETANERQMEMETEHKIKVEDLSIFYEDEKKILRNLMEEARLEYLQQIENMSNARNQELKELEEKMEKTIDDERKRVKEHADKLVENAEAITRETLAACRAESEERVKRVITESDTKVNNMVREMEKVTDNEIRLANEKFTTSLKCVETEKLSLEEKLSEANLEITQLKSTLEELKNAAETQESFSQSLQAELDRAEAELAEKKEEFRNFKDHIRTEAAEMVSRRRRFEVVMSENQASLAALSNRLAQSDNEVKRLQRELEISDTSISDYRDLLSTMQNNVKHHQEQMQLISEQLKTKENLIDEIEENCRVEIQTIKLSLEKKIDTVMETTANEVSRLQEECTNKTKLNIELKKMLDEMSTKWNDVQIMLLQFEEQMDEQSIEIANLEIKNAKLEIELKNQVNLLNESKTREFENEENLQKLKELRVKIEDIQATNLHMKEKIEKSEEEKKSWKTVETSLMENLKKEKLFRENSERELNVLSDTFERIKSEYEELNEKYAEVLGHHNNHQRIKHISKLKDKILSQQKDNLKLKQELECKTKLIEQLTMTTTTKLSTEKIVKLAKGKENVCSLGKTSAPQKIRTNSSTALSKSANTTPTASPSKPLTPLRNRND
ncbi:putative leucine-rich repeat-containing protein DDB_G0290503 isoform X2 [Leptopilina heterotoma]|uniref:putative leucine-rich repeat-containing protein DDB_G0290503 isoform X2 n=1 Tax=Leptopilina heterotoma TaxID=63436 RepID=UPI001CA97BA9|nr:putative leucine-rich repeat-containing protein DDB_G0290503 isoform X2 [Leptopilina heterotoma]